jgi:hypothetical protein
MGETNSHGKSMLFGGAVGETVSGSCVSKHDYLIDPTKFASEGNWAFCRFEGEEVPALRLGFQRGGFNAGPSERESNLTYLQLHLEMMTREGAILWLPSGMYPATYVISDSNSMDIRLDYNGQNIIRLQGWPTMECHFRSEEGDLQADLRFALKSVTTLPDCVLPHCLFAMWESMGEVSGEVRYKDRLFAVKGRVFFDHTRVIPRRHLIVPRQMYLYTTLYFEDGGGLFGYHSVDANGRLIDGYCFYVYLDPAGNGRFCEDVSMVRLIYDADDIAKTWEIAIQLHDCSLIVSVGARHSPVLRSWGSPSAPQTRREFSIIPLVLDGSARIEDLVGLRVLNAYGLAEYFNAELWPADQATMTLHAKAAHGSTQAN